MMRAWHFVGERLRDGRSVPADGVWLEHDGPLVLCESGLHASVDPFDALQYAPGPILCLVECDGEILHGHDKLVCQRRRIVARRDSTEGLRCFARIQALSVIEHWPDAPDVVLDYLMTGDETIRAAARAAAWAAAWAAARDAARAAAMDAARDAARDAAWAAARDAARAAASAAASAAESAAERDAARDAARQDWTALVYEAFAEEVE